MIMGVDVLDAGAAYLSEKVEGGSGLVRAVSLAYPILESAAVVFAFGASLLVVGSLVFRRSPRSFITRHPRFKWKWFGAGAALVAGIQLTAFAWTVGLSAPTSPYAQLASTPLVIAFCALALLFYAPAVLGEELLFRGWLVGSGEATRRRQILLAILSAAVFSLAHMQWDSSSMALRLVTGLAYAWSVVRLGGLELALGAHLAKNASLVWLIGLPGEHRWEGRDYEISVAIAIATSIALIALAEVLARRTSHRNRAQI